MAVGNQGNVTVLFENQVADATGTGFVLVENSRGHYISVTGDLNGGTVQIEMEIAGNWGAVDGGLFDALGVRFLVGCGKGKKLRAVLAGGSGAADVTVAVTN